MAPCLNINYIFPVQMRFCTVHHNRKPALGIDEVKFGHESLIVQKALMVLTDSAAEELEYPCDLGLLVKLQLPELVIECDHRLRFHEKSGSR